MAQTPPFTTRRSTLPFIERERAREGDEERASEGEEEKESEGAHSEMMGAMNVTSSAHAGVRIISIRRA